jgi:hypothetical protein
MTNEPTAPNESKNRNILLWCCLAALVVFCLISFCLISIAGLSLFSSIDPLGLDLKHQFEDFSPWLEYQLDPSLGVDLPETYDEDDTDESGDTSEEPMDSDPIEGITQLVQFQSENFTFSFFYPEGWDPEVEEYESAAFYDPDSYTYLSVGRDWLCQGCSTAYDVAVHFMETIEFQALPDSFVVLEDMPYTVSTGEDAHFSAYEWLDLDGNYMWAYDLSIYIADPVEDTTIYFVLWGDDYEYFEQYRDLFEKIINSYTR